MAECSRCTLILSMQKMLLDGNITIDRKDKEIIISEFTQGNISFRQAGERLGLDEETMSRYLPIENLDRHIN